eukprot:1651848-Lingulodinium_polyedra.AAC.1
MGPRFAEPAAVLEILNTLERPGKTFANAAQTLQNVRVPWDCPGNTLAEPREKTLSDLRVPWGR